MTDERTGPAKPSLDVIRDELDIERAAQAKRAESSDSRAVAIIAGSLVACTFLFNTKSAAAIPGIFCAVMAAGYGVRVLWPITLAYVGPRSLRNFQLTKPEDETKAILLDQRLENYEFNEAQLKIKNGRLKRAMAWLVAAVVIGLIIAAVSLVADSTGNPKPSPGLSTSP